VIPRSALARVTEALDKIERDRSLNAWSYVDRTGALASAQASDERHAHGQALGALDGALVALKANIAVKDWPWDAGIDRLRSRMASEDAPLVTHLRAAGAILLGLTQMDEAALGASGLSIDGPIGLPHRVDYSPGGSSGGAAVAVAAGHCEVAVGTDTIGSVRIPAALSGLCALKPRRQALSLSGIEPLHPDYDTAGPIASSVTEVLRLYTVLKGTEVNGDVLKRGPTPASTLVYLTGNTLTRLPLATRQAYTQVVDQLRQRVTDQSNAVSQVVDARTLCNGAELEALIDALPLARRALFTLCETRLADHWRERDSTRLLECARLGEAQGFSPSLQAMLAYGAGLTLNRRQEFEDVLASFRTHWDALSMTVRRQSDGPVIWLLPTTPVGEFRHQDGVPKELADWTCLASITGWPALSMPADSLCAPTDSSACGQTPSLSLQWVSTDLDDERLCRTALEVSRDLLASCDPNTLGSTDV
jgi:aspartyl-tRNA(Asn)/glutamyl-tRNA(Gln) amidotransferase subunit A